jgi:hypothetical protein
MCNQSTTQKIFQLCDYFGTRKCSNILNATPSDRTNQRKTTKSRLIRYIDKGKQEYFDAPKRVSLCAKADRPHKGYPKSIFTTRCLVFCGCAYLVVPECKGRTAQKFYQEDSLDGEEIPGWDSPTKWGIGNSFFKTHRGASVIFKPEQIS